MSQRRSFEWGHQAVRDALEELLGEPIAAARPHGAGGHRGTTRPAWMVTTGAGREVFVARPLQEGAAVHRWAERMRLHDFPNHRVDGRRQFLLLEHLLERLHSLEGTRSGRAADG